MTDQTKEKIQFNTELIRLFSVLLLATSGGVISLIIEGNTATEMFFAAGGMIIIFVSIIVLYKTYSGTMKLLKNGV